MLCPTVLALRSLQFLNRQTMNTLAYICSQYMLIKSESPSPKELYSPSPKKKKEKDVCLTIHKLVNN